MIERWWFRCEKPTVHHSGIYSTLSWTLALWVLCVLVICIHLVKCYTSIKHYYCCSFLFFLRSLDFMLHLIHHFWHLKGTSLRETVGLPFNYSAGDKKKEKCCTFAGVGVDVCLQHTFSSLFGGKKIKNKATVIILWKENSI